jgi:NADPH-dependent 2,4-dienoyl-CoA reductase/sulfur reductase-like enzyme
MVALLGAVCAARPRVAARRGAQQAAPLARPRAPPLRAAPARRAAPRRTAPPRATADAPASPATTSATSAGKPTAVVVGAGVGGLAMAGRLARAGYAVQLLEKNPGVGGRMQSFSPAVRS